MKYPHHEQIRLLAIAASARGFGFAVMDGFSTLVDWGVKSATGAKNSKSVLKSEELIDHYSPDSIVLEDCGTKHVRRSQRIRALGRQVIDLSRKRHLRVNVLTREQIRKVFFANGRGTKHAVAQILAERFRQNWALVCRLSDALG
jgi:hypothetical protein